MRLAVLFSGGKDSTMALHRVLERGHEVTTLLTMLPANADSYMFHYPNVKWTTVQGKCMGIPVVQENTDAVKEEEVEDMKKAIASLDVEGVVSGALASRYQKSRVDKVCKELGIKSIAPLWDKGDKRLFREIVKVGFRPVITGVAAEGLDESWLGKEVTYEVIDELSEIGMLHIMFEGGEAESFVIDGPIFKNRIEIAKAEKKWDGTRGELEIRKLAVKPKAR